MAKLLLRELVGQTLREERLAASLTLRDVSGSAQISLGYLSEIERGQKEASSELLAAVCSALEISLPVLLHKVADAAEREHVHVPSMIAA